MKRRPKLQVVIPDEDTAGDAAVAAIPPLRPSVGAGGSAGAVATSTNSGAVGSIHNNASTSSSAGHSPAVIAAANVSSEVATLLPLNTADIDMQGK